jgi:hypothetical protein
MTKPKRAAHRANEWTFDMPAGLATHMPTGLQLTMVPLGPHVAQPERFAALQAQGWRSTGVHKLRDDKPDRRAVQIDPQDANAPGVTRWAALVDLEARGRAGEALAQLHGPLQAAEMIERICHEAGERWVYRAGLERGWPNGQRAT